MREVNKKKARIEFGVLIDRCNCSQASLEGECFPSKCFPTLYSFLYPKGGFNGVSDAARRSKLSG